MPETTTLPAPEDDKTESKKTPVSARRWPDFITTWFQKQQTEESESNPDKKKSKRSKKEKTPQLDKEEGLFSRLGAFISGQAAELKLGRKRPSTTLETDVELGEEATPVDDHETIEAAADDGFMGELKVEHDSFTEADELPRFENLDENDYFEELTLPVVNPLAQELASAPEPLANEGSAIENSQQPLPLETSADNSGGGGEPPELPPDSPKSDMPEPEEPADLPETSYMPSHETSTPQSVTYIETNNAGPAAAAFVGAELLSRRRDRKLRRQNKQSKTEIQAVKAEAQKHAESLQATKLELSRKIEQVEKRIPTNMAKPPEVAPPMYPFVDLAADTFKTATKAAERAPYPAFSSNEQPAFRTDFSAPERPQKESGDINGYEDVDWTKNLPKAPEQPEKPQSEPASKELESMPMETIIKREHELGPETVMKEVEKAAKAEMPIELEFEKRHEIKDDAAAGLGSTASSATSIREILQKQAAELAKKLDNSYAKSNLPTVGDLTPMYRKAVGGGFGGALAIIVFALILWAAN